MAFVSVVIPVRNHPAELERALRSVEAQTYTDWECLVIENGSDDPSVNKAVVESMENARIRFIDIGLVDNANYARNAGIEKANGDYIAFLDSDDEWLSNHLALSLEKIRTTGALAVYGNFYVDNGLSRVATKSPSIRKDEAGDKYRIAGGGKAQTSSFVIEKNACLEVGWDNDLRRGQDVDFFIRMHASHLWAHVHEPAVVVYWQQGAARNIDTASCLKMYTKHEKQWDTESRVTYLRSLYLQGIQYGDREDLIDDIRGRLLREEDLSMFLWLLAKNFWLARVYLSARGMAAYGVHKVRGIFLGRGKQSF
ncbi:glycosyl transferase family 2 [Desulfatibacillum aliphaticivorans]|uniref:Glycosyl transferase family 2 n=1 Tax=Desulfatibacillum aliphaticivorans TaxID=218208 RepID=B8F9T0_DESAL|nr:glycosyltransferase family 2 protein [Desulfatibacillum aliphaticivorans]ACL03026.1 glycosyl transferase family 2 [Desulfatibacillum aliphaticivorans]